MTSRQAPPSDDGFHLDPEALQLAKFVYRDISFQPETTPEDALAAAIQTYSEHTRPCDTTHEP